MVDYFIDDGWLRVCDLPPHGSPADRGSADRYYGRPFAPHYYPMGTHRGERITPPLMTPKQVEEYKYAYDTEEDRKNWGADSPAYNSSYTEEA